MTIHFNENNNQSSFKIIKEIIEKEGIKKKMVMKTKAFFSFIAQKIHFDLLLSLFEGNELIVLRLILKCMCF